MFEEIKHSMETIAGVAVYPSVSLAIFFLFFVGLGFWAATYNKTKLSELSHMPLEDNPKNPSI
jgi:hypothetical protein